MAARACYVLFFSLVFLSPNGVMSLTHDQKLDLITKAYDALINLVHSLIDVHKDIEEGASSTGEDLATLDESKVRSEYEVTIMDIDHQTMLAELAKRQDVVTPEEQQIADDRGEAIQEAKQKVGELEKGIAETKTKVDTLNQELGTTTLSTEDLKRLQDKANAQSDNPADHITLPDSADIKKRAGEELTNMQTVIDTVADSAIRQEAQHLKDTIQTKLYSALDDSQSNIAALSMKCKEIDAALLQFKGLDLYGSASRMEL